MEAGLADPEVDHPVNEPVGGRDPFLTAFEQTSPHLGESFQHVEGTGTLTHFLAAAQDKAMAGFPFLVTQLGWKVTGTVMMVDPLLDDFALALTLMLATMGAKGSDGHSFNSTDWLVAGSMMEPKSPRGILNDDPEVPTKFISLRSKSLAVKAKTTG